jgi:zinc protease
MCADVRRFAAFVLLACAGSLSLSAWAALPIQHWQMDNGAQVYFVENHDLPLLDVSVEFPAGSGRDARDKPGAAGMTRHLMALGAGDLSEDDISKKLADVGAVLGGDFDRDRAGYSLRTLSSERERGQALAVLARILQQPAFPENVLEREKARVIASLREAATKPEYLAEKAFSALLYGTHPYALPPSGTPESVATLTRADIVAFYRENYLADRAVVTIVGDVTPAQAREIAAQLTGRLPRATTPLPSLPQVAPTKGETRRVAHPATQSHILMGVPGMTRDDPDYFPLLVGNYVLGGGGFASRLMDEVRQKRGLAYSVYSYFLPLKQEGPFQIGLQTRRDQADEALAVVRATLAEFVAKGPTEKELEAAKQNLVGGFPLRLDSNRKILAQVAMIGFYGLPLTYLDDYPAQVEKVTLAQVKDAFSRRIKPENLVTVVVAGEEAGQPGAISSNLAGGGR